jgi:hypothetical protein
LKSRVAVKKLDDQQVLDTKSFVENQLDEDSLVQIPSFDGRIDGKAAVVDDESKTQEVRVVHTSARLLPQDSEIAEVSDELMKKRAEKNKSDFTCDCSMAKKADRFSSLLSGALADLHKCQGGHEPQVAKGESAASTSVGAKDGGQCSSQASSLQHNPKKGLKTVAGRHKTFELTGFDLDGQRCTTGGDLFYWGRLSKHIPGCEVEKSAASTGECNGFPKFNVDIRDMGKGVYKGSFRVFEPGDYWLDVTWLGKHVEGSPMRVTVSAARNQKADNGRTKGPICPPHAAKTGTTGHQGGYWKSHEQWQGAHCSVARISQVGALKCLRNKKIFFAGDSLNRCTFWTFAGWLAGMENKSKKKVRGEAVEGGAVEGEAVEGGDRPTGARTSGGFLLLEPASPGSMELKKAEKQRSHFDGWDQLYLEYVPKYNTSLFYSAAWNSAFAMNYPQGGNPPSYYDGKQAKKVLPMLNWQSRSNVATVPGDKGNGQFAGDIPKEWLAELKRGMVGLSEEGGQPDAIVLGMASHDMIANDVEAYRTNLEVALWKLRFDQGYKGKLIWVAVTPPVSEKQGEAFEAYKYLQTITKTKEYNQIAAEVVAGFGGVVVDAYSIALTRPEQSYDGQHYVGNGKTTLDDVVYMNIRAAIVHELCAEGKQRRERPGGGARANQKPAPTDTAHNKPPAESSWW